MFKKIQQKCSWRYHSSFHYESRESLTTVAGFFFVGVTHHLPLISALGFFRLPVKIKDIARTISRTAWGAPIKEDDVEEIISTLKDVESSDGKYILRKK